MKFQHLIVTRYTLKGWAYDEFSPEWLEERMRVFRTYCVPSISQQDVEFRWLILCDETTDPDYVDRIRAIAQSVPALEVVTTSRERGIWSRHAVASVLDTDTDLLITTRLDNDDAMHAGALRVMQDYIDPFARSSLDGLLVRFPRGYRYDEPSGKMFSSYWMDSPFITLLEKLDGDRKNPRNVYFAQHPRIHLEVATHLDESIPAWLQVIHGRAQSTNPEALAGVALTGGNRRSVVSEDTDIEVDPAGIGPAFGLHLWDR
jgi:Putative rhamnosyl transferase